MAQKSDGRQYSLNGIAEFLFGDTVTAVAADALELPEGATVTGGYVVVDVASDAATSDSLDVGDAADPDRYTATPINLKTLGATALDVTGFETSAPTMVQVTRTEVGVPTTGAFRLILEYVKRDRSNENQGDVK